MKAHVLIVADGRSPTTHDWIENIQAMNYQVSLISTFACDRIDGLAKFHILPTAFSRFSRSTPSQGKTRSRSWIGSWVSRFSPGFQTLRYVLGPLTLPRTSAEYQRLVADIQPDLVHALRVPFEGMLSSFTPAGIPLLAAIWGNDLTLHARATLPMRRWTRRCLSRADGLSADTHRDLRLAQDWGLSPDSPTLFVPGSGGVDLEGIQLAGAFDPARYGIPTTVPWIVNPRGIRPGSVHQKVFFTTIPKITQKYSEAVFICPGLQGMRAVEGWVRTLGISKSVFLLPQLPQAELWALMKLSPLFVSPSSHDGTPNSFLEALACGCFPVVGDIDSLREWIQPGENGLLVDPRDPDALAEAILWGLDHPGIRQTAAEINLALVEDKAARAATRPRIDAFYKQFLN